MDKKIVEAKIKAIATDVVEANPYYALSRLSGMRIMPARRAKYSGDEDPYTNFKLMYFNLRMMNPTINMKQLFMFYILLKQNRLIVDNNDFSDDSQRDSIRDESNYLDIYGGALVQREEENPDEAFSWSWIEDTTDQWNFAGKEAKKWYEIDPETFWEKIPNDDSPLWPVVCVDFNGVLDQYGGWHGYVESYPMAEDADWFLKELRDDFNTIVILTATHPIELVTEWLDQYGLLELVDYVTNWKVPANVYIDDRAVTHNGDFWITLQIAKKFIPHWKREGSGT